jgi:hypothetical protein
MPLPVFDTQDAVPEAFRGEYEERDGKWHPKVPDVTKLNSALQSERDRATEQERLRKAAERERDDLKRAEKAKAAGISAEELEQIRVAEREARKPLEDELTTVRAENRKLKLTDRVKALALAAGVMPDRIKQAMKILDERTDLTDADGIVVKDEAGKVTTETIEDFLAKTFKKESPWFYAGAGASGSGASGSNGSGGGTATDTTTPAQALERKRAAMPGAL